MTKQLLFILLCCLLQMETKAQFSESQVTDCYYFKNAFVVQKPGMVLPATNVIIRKGLITDIGANLKVPFDAKVINTDSMYIYAGFIDGMSNAGLKKEEKRDQGRGSSGGGRPERPRIQGSPTYEQSGVTPQLSVIGLYKSNESSVGDLRKAGFTASHVMPEGKLFPGQGSVFLLTDEGSADKLVLRKDFSVGAKFVGNMAPSTTIGAMAKYRDVFKNTEYAIKNAASYQLNPKGMERPEIADEINALMPVVKKEKSLYFVGEKTKDIHRILTMNKEFNYSLVLVGLKDGGHVLPMIKSSNVPVLLSLNLPEEVKDPNKKEEKKEESSDKKDDDDKKEEGERKEGGSKEKADKKEGKEKKDGEKKEPMSEEMKMLEVRKFESYKEYVSQASKMEKAGITFAFTSLDTKSKDIQGNVRKMVESGLTENTALAALTTNAAQILGISNIVGTVEAGKMANLVITDKSFFEDKSQIKYVVVEGKVFDYTEAPKKPKKEDKSGDGDINLNGEWSFDVETPDETQRGTLTFSNAPDNTEVILKSNNDPEVYKSSEVNIENKKVKTTVSINMEGQMVPVSFDLDFDGDSYSGTVSLPGMGSFPISGRKNSGPKN